jgi:hypothetical protein
LCKRSSLLQEFVEEKVQTRIDRKDPGTMSLKRKRFIASEDIAGLVTIQPLIQFYQGKDQKSCFGQYLRFVTNFEGKEALDDPSIFFCKIRIKAFLKMFADTEKAPNTIANKARYFGEVKLNHLSQSFTVITLVERTR